ncbi:MAG: SemiSWEET transporter [Dehalococcoidales bacterium]|nr:SemiSWEET transporter [Dehalococcoidales bacterium]
MFSGEILGFVAGALTTCAFIPQVIRVYKLKSARDISMPFTLAMIMGGVLWLVYGIVSGLTPVILWNAFSVALVLGLLGAKLRYGR